MISLACSEAPAGHQRWTVRLLADKAVELRFAESVSHMTVQRVLKKTSLSLTSANTGKSHRREAAAFVANMEDVLDVYHLPYDPDYPVVCMDESCKQMIGEVRNPIPCKLGQPARIDDEYVRNGVAEIQPAKIK